MTTPALLLELILKPRGDAPPTTSVGYALAGAYAIELGEAGRRLASHRLLVRGAADLAGESGQLFGDEAALLREIVRLIASADCLVTARGQRLELPVLEALALRHGVPLPGHFEGDDPYRARRSPYNVAGQLDLLAFLADGDRRLRGLEPALVLSLLFREPLAAGLSARDGEGPLAAAKRRALGSYLLYLRVQRLRGLLDEDQLTERLSELASAGLESALAGATRPAWGGAARAPVATTLDGVAPGLLAFDIETVVDLEALSRAVGRSLEPAEVEGAVQAISGPGATFAPAPFHRVVALAMVYWDPGANRIDLARLVLGERGGAGAPLEEEDLLSTFWRVAAGQRLVSYNGKRFDLPVLLYRSLPYPLEAGWYLASARPPHAQYRHPHSRRQLDIFDRLAGGLSPGKLGDLLGTLGLPGKLDADGSDVQRMWESGKGDEVGDYCLQDAAQTFLLGMRYLAIAGELSPSRLREVTLAARERFGREPSLASILERGQRFFLAGG